MKKLLLILLCVPLIFSCGENEEKKEKVMNNTPTTSLREGCNYGENINDASELCKFYQGNNFSTYQNADISLDKILSVTGMSKRFVLKECDDISNCVATSYKGIRYILYDKDFMDIIATNTNSWSNLSILAHEIGHHVNGHSLDLIVYASETVEPPTLSESRAIELEADEYSGFVMYKLGATLSQAQEAIRLICTNEDDTYSTHPKLDKRLAAIERGYNNAKNQGSNNDYSPNSSTLTAEDYFYKSYDYVENGEYQLAIDNYTEGLRLYPDDIFITFNRGVTYYNLGNYEDAIADFTRVIRIDPDYADAYINRGNAYGGLGSYEDAISDYTRAIRINPDYTEAYNNRGLAYYKLGNYEDAIADFTRAIRINPDYTEAYNNRGNAYDGLGSYEDAISDYTRAIIIDPDYADAYYNRGMLKENAGLSYCSDYKIGCELGDEDCCEWYYKQCK
jgi:tetratricopeptide (TPR) repeat protein